MASLSVVITTYNEAVNIRRAVESAQRLTGDVLVIDSGSTDDTVALAESLGARSMTRPFDDMALQRNAALAEGKLQGEHVLFMDADEMLTEPFARALTALLDARPEIDGVRICRKFHFRGKWIRSAATFPHYIDRVVRVGTVTFRKEGHGEVFVGGETYVELAEPLHDEDLKPIGAWIERHNRYAAMEAAQDEALLARGSEAPRWRRLRARLRRVPGWPLFALGYFLVVRRGLLEGPRGWTYCSMKAMYEYLVQLHGADRRRRGA